MSRSIAQPPDSINTHNATGDTIIGHSPEVAQSYREAAAEAALKGPGRVIKSSQPVAPGPQLPMSGVANATVGRHLAELRTQAAGLARSVQSPPLGPGGYQVDHLVTQQRQARADLELLREEIGRIEAMDDYQVREFAYKLGAR